MPLIPAPTKSCAICADQFITKTTVAANAAAAAAFAREKIRKATSASFNKAPLKPAPAKTLFAAQCAPDVATDDDTTFGPEHFSAKVDDICAKKPHASAPEDIRTKNAKALLLRAPHTFGSIDPELYAAIVAAQAARSAARHKHAAALSQLQSKLSDAKVGTMNSGSAHIKDTATSPSLSKSNMQQLFCKLKCLLSGAD